MGRPPRRRIEVADRSRYVKFDVGVREPVRAGSVAITPHVVQHEEVGIGYQDDGQVRHHGLAGRHRRGRGEGHRRVARAQVRRRRGHRRRRQNRVQVVRARMRWLFCSPLVGNRCIL
jgi:hypothetical protein